MKVLHLTREYPPHVYGGAGVHVENLTRELAALAQVEVRCFGEQRQEAGPDRPEVRGFQPWKEALEGADERIRRALQPLSVDLAMAALPTDAQVVHCHT